MSKLIRLAVASVIAHAAIATLHGTAHQVLGVRLSVSQVVYVAIVITLAPIVAGVLLWKKVETAGAVILVISMTGSLIFGVYNHFVAISPDHVSHVALMSRSVWVMVFQVTAFLLALSEIAGTIIGALLLKRVFVS